MQDDANQGTARPLLDAVQVRVLGCLIEKEATTPDVYPLTVNAAQAAANQKTAREPVLQLDPGEVQHALRQLEQMGLAKQHFSSRAERYAHCVNHVLGLTDQELALLGLLLLRGAQTAHELLARADRMARFEGVDDVRHHLDRLARREAPLVAVQRRGSGQREERYAHLLCGPADDTGAADALPSTIAPTAPHPLIARVQALEAEVAALREKLAQLEATIRG